MKDGLGGGGGAGPRSDRSRTTWVGDFMLRNPRFRLRRGRLSRKDSLRIRISIAATAMIDRIASAIHPQGISLSILPPSPGHGKPAEKVARKTIKKSR